MVKRYWTHCAGWNRDGSPCNRKVPTRPSGVYLVSEYCWQHRKRIQPPAPRGPEGRDGRQLRTGTCRGSA